MNPPPTITMFLIAVGARNTCAIGIFDAEMTYQAASRVMLMEMFV